MGDVHSRKAHASTYSVGEIKALIGPIFGLDPGDDWGYVIMCETPGTGEDEGDGFVITNYHSKEGLTAHLQDVIDSANLAYEEGDGHDCGPLA